MTATRNLRPNVPWFESPFFERELERSDLDERTREQVAFFAEHGYLVVRPGIPDLDRLADEITAAMAEEHATVANRIQDAWRYVPAVRELATRPEVMRVLESLYGRRPIPFQTLNFARGTQQRTHSDLVHFNSLPQRFMAGVWFALEDVGPHNGALHYYPGSHRLAVYEPHDLGLHGSSVRSRNTDYRSYEDFLARLIDDLGLQKETVRMRRGEAIIWSANLLHGGDPIEDPQSTRRSQVTHCYFEGCRYYTPLYSDPPLGRYDWTRVVDITTGKEQPHVYNGERVRLPARTRARYAVEGRLKESETGRRVFRRVKHALIRRP
jgi:hypothetical protein